MRTQQLQPDVAIIQAAIYHVALSLDAFLVNGIHYGVVQSPVFPGFLQKTSSNLLRDLTTLEGQAACAPIGGQTTATEVLASLSAKSHELIDLVAGLSSFRALPLQQLRAAVSQIPVRREKCVQLIQELEGCFRTPKPFYQTRPSDSAAAVTEFLANLECMFTEEWAAANASVQEKGTR